MRRYLAQAVTALLLCVGMQAASTPSPSKVETTTPAAPNTQLSPIHSGKTGSIPAKTNKKTKLTRIFHRKNKKQVQIGTASWYGAQFNGRQTASGELFDMNLLTAASKSLPLGSWVKVTNLHNGKSVIVRINDRGPYVGNRIMDVSAGAAEALDLKPQGVGKVRIETVEPEELATITFSPTLF